MSDVKNILIGKITSAHGIKGYVNILSYAANPSDIEKYSTIFDKDKKKLQIKLISGAKGKNHDIFISEISGIKDRNQAEMLRNTELFITRDQLENTAEDEFYYVDLIGLEARDLSGKRIGKIINVNDFGAGGMIEIEFDKADKIADKTQILPFNHQTIPEVNLKKGYLIVDFPEFVEIRSEDE